ncbi:hypothetical protein F0562_017676 [Nyssa sinensis]|uniref:Protein kinase domain-containing protein n=1 Tax=Nyssa sinensis TaxID=561372 RepID=A0A5J4ZFF6_9ASTE|nr:hypothetical protein F0562_017676 [Nyssa sinensis]
MRTFEYLAPEYGETGKDSSLIDIYSFGVILLKLITGPRSTEDTNGQPFLRWARPLLKEKNYGDLIDPRVQHSHDLYQLVWMVRVVEKCLNWKPDRRCSINEVVNLLTSITEGSNVEDYSPPESDCSEQITG